MQAFQQTICRSDFEDTSAVLLWAFSPQHPLLMGRSRTSDVSLSETFNQRFLRHHRSPSLSFLPSLSVCLSVCLSLSVSLERLTRCSLTEWLSLVQRLVSDAGRTWMQVGCDFPRLWSCPALPSTSTSGGADASVKSSICRANGCTFICLFLPEVEFPLLEITSPLRWTSFPLSDTKHNTRLNKSAWNP